ncbi:MAG: DUF1848 family protein [Sphingobacteriia bacterium]|nr:DUF1848 family protein [Sphingobacteriia bacterium]NCC41026.1 DUF1848 family protein [Gammaproteobacteria bacterium]
MMPKILCQRLIDFHLRCFRRIAGALSGATHVVNTSVVEPYLKTVRRMDDPTVRYRHLDPERHRTVAVRYPGLRQIAKDEAPLIEELAAVAAEYHMELRLCSNPELDLPTAQCCSLEGLTPYGARTVREVAALPQAPTRSGCRCLKTADIGMDNTCIAGCRYCYAVQSQKSAIENFKRHDPTAAMLR